MNTNTNRPESAGKAPDNQGALLHPDMQPQAIAPIVPTPQPEEAPLPAPVLPDPAPAAPPVPPPPRAELRHFKKVMVNMPFIVNRQRVGFEVLSKNTGVIRLHSLNDAQIVDALDRAATARKGGIVAISEGEYAELKKKLQPATLERRQRLEPKLQVWRGPILSKRRPPQNVVPNGKANAAPAAAAEPAPVKQDSSSTDRSSVGVPSPVSGNRPGGQPTGGASPGPTAKPNTVRRTPIVRAPRTAVPRR